MGEVAARSFVPKGASENVRREIARIHSIVNRVAQRAPEAIARAPDQTACARDIEALKRGMLRLAKVIWECHIAPYKYPARLETLLRTREALKAHNLEIALRLRHVHRLDQILSDA